MDRLTLLQTVVALECMEVQPQRAQVVAEELLHPATQTQQLQFHPQLLHRAEVADVVLISVEAVPVQTDQQVYLSV